MSPVHAANNRAYLSLITLRPPPARIAANITQPFYACREQPRSPPSNPASNNLILHGFCRWFHRRSKVSTSNQSFLIRGWKANDGCAGNTFLSYYMVISYVMSPAEANNRTHLLKIMYAVLDIGQPCAVLVLEISSRLTSNMIEHVWFSVGEMYAVLDMVSIAF
jgi:hypothetical protein